MLYDACATWLGVYKMDGLRFDSASQLPMELMQRITWQLREKFPGKLLTADMTPEDPNMMKQ
jgi:1,4-alpha-glucan branching enzyme